MPGTPGVAAELPADKVKYYLNPQHHRPHGDLLAIWIILGCS